jgi:hypothetical protein
MIIYMWSIVPRWTNGTRSLEEHEKAWQRRIAMELVAVGQADAERMNVRSM